MCQVRSPPPWPQLGTLDTSLSRQHVAHGPAQSLRSGHKRVAGHSSISRLPRAAGHTIESASHHEETQFESDRDLLCSSTLRCVHQTWVQAARHASWRRTGGCGTCPPAVGRGLRGSRTGGRSSGMRGRHGWDKAAEAPAALCPTPCAPRGGTPEGGWAVRCRMPGQCEMHLKLCVEDGTMQQ